MFQRVTMNLVGARTRYETLEGKQYLVVPTVMITEGVHNGSQGPLYYPSEELSKNPLSWNHKPVVVYHPTLNGEGISACDPAVVASQGVGMLFETAYDGRLKTECWLDEGKLKRIDNRVLESLQNGSMVEVSTGLFHDKDPTPGKWNGKDYTGTVRNIQPDHLAILPDQKGSCSIDDGAGLLRNSDGSTLSYEDIRCQIRDLVKGPGKYDFCYVCDLYPKYAVYECDDKCYKVGYKVRNSKVALDGEPEEVRKVTSYVTANGTHNSSGRAYLTMNGKIIVGNEDHQGPLKAPHEGELSDPMKRQQMGKALSEKYSGTQQEGDWGGWVTSLFANYVVYSKDNKLFRLPYTYDDDKIRFDGEPEEVERVSEYRTRRQTPIDGTASPYNINKGTTVPNPATNTIHQGAHQMIHDATQHADAHHAPGGASDSQQRTSAGGARKDSVDKMISGGHAQEEDRKFLMDLPDDHFEKVSKYVMKGATQPITPYSYEGIGDRSNAHSSTSHNQRPQVSANQYIEQAPLEVREVLRNAMATHAAEKQRMVKTIIANRNNRFSEQWLMQQSMDQLRGMAALAGGMQQVANYSGQADVPMFLETQSIQNQVADEETLELPVLSWSD